MKKTSQTSPEAMAKYQEICEVLSETKGIEVNSMFGMPAVKRDKKAFAGLFGDAMVFKLSGDAHTKALGLAGAELFDPSGMKRPMKAWVVVPARHKSRWLAFAKQALDGVAAAAAPKRR
jgi:hypothetical protein